MARLMRWALVFGVTLLTVSAGYFSLRKGSAAAELPGGEAVQVFDFEAGVADWVSLDPNARVEAMTGAGEAKAGNGALAFRYTPSKGAFSVVGCQKVAIPGARAASFFLKMGQPTILVFTLREKDDSRYQTMLYNPAGQWTPHTVDFSELNLADDAKDENNKLDVDQVDSVGFIDIAIVRAQTTDTPGQPRILYLDELRFLSTSFVAGDTGKGSLDDFEGGAGAWVPVRLTLGKEIGMDVDGEAQVLTTEQPENVKSGVKALEYHYKAAAGAVSALLRPLAGPTVAKAAALTLWAKTSEPTVMFLALTERGGARYNSIFYSPKDHYQQMTFTPTDFQLDDNSKDVNGHLDFPEIANVSIADAAPFLATVFKLPLEGGERVLYLDGLEATPPGKEGKDTDANTVWRDAFRDGGSHWLPLRVTFDPLSVALQTEGVLQVLHPQDRPAGVNALEFSYLVAEKMIVALMRPVSPLPAGSASSLRLVARTDSDTTLIVTLKERDESEYQHQVELRKADGWKETVLPLSEFSLGEGKTDENGRLDLDQLKDISIADVSGAMGEPGENTLWIESVSLTAK